MDIRWIGFGEIEIEGRRYPHDVVIDRGRVTKRHKAPSKPFRGDDGHTPLSASETIPWGGSRLVIGTGADGRLPITPDLLDEARRRGIELSVLPTADACRLLQSAERRTVRAILHVTC
jgi:hypothetical protein